MPTVPCPVHVSCPCADSPITNYSVEDPDARRFLGRRFVNYVPKLGSTPSVDDGNDHYISAGCMGVCYSEVSQEEADQCAELQAQECANDGYDGHIHDDGNGPIPTYRNTAQSCKVTCTSGSDFYGVQAAGTIFGRSQYAADFFAYMVACQKAQRKRLCLSKTCVPLCVGGDLNCEVIADSGQDGRWQVYGLPAWAHVVELSRELLLQGTPTAPGNTDIVVIFTTVPDMNYASIAFQIQVLGLSNPTTLPACDYGVAYNYQMIGIGGSGAPYTYGLAGGALPNGLSISSTGLISGTPVLCEDSSFSIYVRDEDGNLCTKDFTMAIAFPAPGANVFIYGLEQWYTDLVPFGYPASMNNIPFIVPLTIWELSLSSMVPLATSFTQRVTLNSPGTNDVVNLTWTYGPSDIAVWQKDKAVHSGSPFGTYTKTNEVPPSARNPATIYVAPM